MGRQLRNEVQLLTEQEAEKSEEEIIEQKINDYGNKVKNFIVKLNSANEPGKYKYYQVNLEDGAAIIRVNKNMSDEEMKKYMQMIEKNLDPFVVSDRIEENLVIYLYHNSYSIAFEGMELIRQISRFEGRHFYNLHKNLDNIFEKYHDKFKVLKTSLNNANSDIKAKYGKLEERGIHIWNLYDKWNQCKKGLFDYNYWHERLNDYKDFENKLSKEKWNGNMDVFVYIDYAETIIGVIWDLVDQLSTTSIRRMDKYEEVWEHLIENDDVESMYNSKKTHFEKRFNSRKNNPEYLREQIEKTEVDIEDTKPLGNIWMASEGDKYKLVSKLVTILPNNPELKQEDLNDFIVKVMYLDWLNEKEEELNEPKDEIRGNANKTNTKKTTVAIFAKRIVDPSKVNVVLAKLHELVDRQTDPKEIVMPIRAAMDAGVLGRPTWGEFKNEFGEEKIKSKSSFTDYTNKDYRYEGENFLKMIEDLKNL